MKTVVKFTWVLLCFVYVANANSQNINYNSSAIILVPDESFLPNANWEKLLYGNTNELFINGNMKIQIAVAPDQSIFICDRADYSISKLDKSGNVISTFGKKGYGNGEFANNPKIWGILNEKLLVVSDAQGRINFFDLNGNFVKLITIDFGIMEIYPLSSGKLIIYGHVPMKTKSKQLLAELDYNTRKYKQIYYTYEDYADVGIQIPIKGGGIYVWKKPFSNGDIFTAVTNEGKLIFSQNNEDIINVFTPDNNDYLQSQFEMNIPPIKVDDKAIAEFYENMKTSLKNRGLDTTYAEKIYEKGFFPNQLPYFYNLMVDRQNNLLLFIYTNNDKDYAFRAYSTDGKFLGESEFKIEGYDLLLNKSPFIFMNNSIYAIALKKGVQFPARIIKCALISE